MEFKTAVSKLEALTLKNSFLIFLCLGLLVSNISLVCLVGWSIMHQKRTIVPVVDRSFTVSDYRVDNSYLRQMALFFVAERLNILPTNVKTSHNILLQYTDPEFHHDFLKLLSDEEEEIIKQNISSVFYVEEVIPDASNLQVEIKGTLNRYVGSLSIPPVHKKYLLKFTYKSSFLKVLSFTEIGETNG